MNWNQCKHARTYTLPSLVPDLVNNQICVCFSIFELGRDLFHCLYQTPELLGYNVLVTSILGGLDCLFQCVQLGGILEIRSKCLLQLW